MRVFSFFFVERRDSIECRAFLQRFHCSLTLASNEPATLAVDFTRRRRQPTAEEFENLNSEVRIRSALRTREQAEDIQTVFEDSILGKRF